MSFCSNCGSQLETGARFCGECGYPAGEMEKPRAFESGTLLKNTSGQGKSAVIPGEIKKWNWGAFFLNWIWGLGNNTFVALLCLIPLVSIIMIFVLGTKGSEWAWRNKRWEGIEHFKRVQKRWAQIGVGLFLLVVLLGLLSLISR